MSAHSHHSHDHTTAEALSDPRYRRVLWAALLINAAMFGVEIAGGLRSGSVSLLADAVDFFGDAVNYGLSLAVLGMGLLWRARAALLKGLSMGLFGVFVLGRTVWALLHGTPPASDHGPDRRAGAVGQCGGGREALCLARGRREHALGLAVQPQ